VLLTDIDGTMTDQGRIPPDLVARLPRLAAAGIEVLPCTGRSAGEALGLARYLPGVRRAIAENGGVLVVPDEPAIPLRPLVERQALHDAATRLAAGGAPWTLAPCSFARLTDQAWERGGRSAAHLAVLREMAAHHGLCLTWSSVHIHLTVQPPDKGAGAWQVLGSEGVLAEETATIGDAPNDEGLWVADRFGVTVGTAEVQASWSALRHHPEVVTASSAEGWMQLADALIAGRPA
jgi:hydroxymethylpyrimidine pyrophosphatase-like HAD family hydrolase